MMTTIWELNDILRKGKHGHGGLDVKGAKTTLGGFQWKKNNEKDWNAERPLSLKSLSELNRLSERVRDSPY